MGTETFTCPCCGYPELASRPYRGLEDVIATRGLDPPYSKHFGDPSYEVCACCGFEFGNDDEPGTGSPSTFEEYLREWIASGCVWFSPEKMPKSWDLGSQLQSAGIPAGS